MQCSEAEGLLNSYVDGELAPGAVTRMEAHLERCEACRVQVQEVQSLCSTLDAASLSYPAPGTLRSRVESLIRSPVVLQGAVRDRMKLLAGMFAGGAFVLAIIIGVVAIRPAPVVFSMADQTMQSHMRSVETSRLTEINSGDSVQVKSWIQKQGIVPPTVHDLSAKGFRLIGGRIERLENRAVPVLVYGTGSESISVYHWPGHCMPAQSGCSSLIGKYRLINWSDTEHHCYAITDMALERLETFSGEFQSHGKQ